MGIWWTPYQSQIARVILSHRRDGGSGYVLKDVQAELPKVSMKMINKVVQGLRENNWVIPGDETQEPDESDGSPAGEEEKPAARSHDKQVKKEKAGGPLVTVTAKAPAPIKFTFAGEEINLEPGTLYQAYMLYQDVKIKCGLKDGFTGFLLDGVAILWQILVAKPKIEGNEVILEVTHGRSTGNGESESGSEG
jgi:hypothetical protein